jgi:hypothetical protein
VVCLQYTAHAIRNVMHRVGKTSFEIRIPSAFFPVFCEGKKLFIKGNNP